ncbi:acyl-CoA dehydrogenase family protein [Kytococcus sp. Marseille-QA3725]
MSTEPTDASLRATLTELLDGRWAGVRQRLRETVDPRTVQAPPDADLEQEREVTTRALLALARQGLTGADPRPTGDGRSDGRRDIGESVAAFETIAALDLSLAVKVGVQFGLFGGAIANLGSEDQHATWLPDVAAGTLLGSFAMTEVGHGSDVQSLETTATHDRATDELVVHSPTRAATKTYIGNAARDAQLAVVFAQLVTPDDDSLPAGIESDDPTRRGIHAVVVPVRDGSGGAAPGVTIGDNGHKGGLAGVDNGTLAFDSVRVPRTNLLSRFGAVDEQGRYSSPIDSPGRRFFTMLGTLVRGRVSVGGGASAAARSALVIATRYAEERRQFEGPDGEVTLLDYRAHQRKLLPAIARSYALALAQAELVETLEEVQRLAPLERDERAQRELESRAAGLKALQTEEANRVLQLTREACGGAGYMATSGITRRRADADVFATFEGDNTVLWQLVAKGLLTNYGKAIGSLNMTGMLRFGATQFSGVLIERTAAKGFANRLVEVARGRDPEDVVMDRAWQVECFDFREKHLLETAAARMRRADRDTPAQEFAAFNDVQDHLLLAARAHVDRVVLEAFAQQVRECEDPQAAELLDQLCDLYALGVIEENAAWFLEHEHLRPAKSKAVTATVNALCEGLRPRARLLVDAFSIPDGWLASTLLDGQDDAGLPG